MIRSRFLTLAATALLSACTQIDTGHVGVESTVGQVKPGVLPPGVYQSITRTINEIDTKEIALVLNDLKPKSKENLAVSDFDVDIYYRIDGAKASALLTRFTGDLTEGKGASLVGHNYVTRQARAVVYNVAPQFLAADMNNKRAEIEEGIRSSLQRELDKELGKDWISIGNVNVRNIVPDASLNESISTAAKTTFEISRKEQEIALAKREAERRIVEARGIAESNRVIAESLSPMLVRLKEIEAQQAFAKAGTHTVIMGGAQPMLSIPAK